MDVIVNDQKQTVASGTTISSLLEKINIEDKSGLAVAVNQQVISRQNWKEFQLGDNDKVLLIKISQGG